MPQQIQPSSQYSYGPVNGGGDILHFVNNNNVPIAWLDKNGAEQGLSFVVSALQNSSATPITGTTGGVFSANGAQASISAPGASALEQIPFRVKMAGVVTLAAGTYTATVQPLLYAGASPLTAAAANAIYSAAAISVTQSSASAKFVPYAVEALLSGDSTSGLMVGSVTGLVNNGAQQGATAPVAIVNAPTSVNFAAAIPLQFAAGVTLSNAASGSVVALGSLFLES